MCSSDLLEFVDSGDRTNFKDVFRAAPIRVPGSLPLRFINVLGIIEKNIPSMWAVTADSDAGVGYRPNKLLNPSGSAYFRSGSGTLPRLVVFNRGTFGTFKPARYGIVPQDVNKAPVAWTLEGSDTDVWTSPTTIDTRSGITGWVSGTEKTFDITSANWKYLRLNVTGIADAGNVLELKQFNLYPYSGTVLDDYHTDNHSKRAHIEDRIRAIRWGQCGRERQLRINGDSLFGGSELLAHLLTVELDDIEGLTGPAFRLAFAYGYGS